MWTLVASQLIEEIVMILTAPSGAARRVAFVLLFACGITGLGLGGASAQGVELTRAPAIEAPDIDEPDVDTPDVDVDPATPRVTAPRLPSADGSLVFHGNYCGPGSKGPGLPPVDALDEACMRHDACSPAVGQGLPSCGCNARLQREASLVARSPRTPDDERVAAQFVADGAKILACR